MPPIKFGLNLYYGLGVMSFEEFQDGHCGGQLGCRNGMNIPVLSLHASPMPPTKFQLNPTYRSIADVISGFSSWPPWRPSWILEQNKFSNSKSPCHPNKFGLNLTYRSVADMAWKFSRWTQWRPSWILEQNDFSNSESLCGSDASQQVSAQSNLRFGWRCCL